MKITQFLLLAVLVPSTVVAGPRRAVRVPAEAEPAPATEPAPESTSYERLGWTGIDRAFLIGGHTSIGSSTIKPGGGTSVESNSNTTEWSAAYLFHFGEGSIWAGPSLGYGTISRSQRDGSDTYDTSSTVFQPGVQLRTVFPSGRDQYIALGGSFSYISASIDERATSSGTTESSDISGSGLGYGGFIAFGQRLGRERSYLLETTVGVSGGGYDYTYRSGSSTNVGNVSGTTVRFGISIGVGQ